MPHTGHLICFQEIQLLSHTREEWRDKTVGKGAPLGFGDTMNWLANTSGGSLGQVLNSSFYPAILRGSSLSVYKDKGGKKPKPIRDRTTENIEAKANGFGLMGLSIEQALSFLDIITPEKLSKTGLVGIVLMHTPVFGIFGTLTKTPKRAMLCLNSNPEQPSWHSRVVACSKGHLWEEDLGFLYSSQVRSTMVHRD